MELRKTTACDVDAVMAIIEQARARIAQLGIDQWQGGYPNLQAIEGDVAAGKGYVAVDDLGGVCATAMVDHEGEPTYDELINCSWLTDSTSADPGYLVVHRVAVGDAGARRGLARFMLESVEEMARDRGYESVRIDTHEGNVPMRSLLSKCGYEECGVIMLSDPAEPTRERIAFEKRVR